MENSTWQLIITSLITILACNGFWTLMQKLSDKKDNKTKLLVGLGHDRIIHLCSTYIERGYITSDEYENLNDYLYEPYKANGGNGSAERLMTEVRKLPIRKS